MPIRPNSRRCGVVCAAFAGLALVSCHPSTTSTTAPYPQVVSAFYSSVAALDAGDTEHAPVYLAQTVKLAPNEPAGWANMALNDLRLSQTDQAAKDLKKAQDLAPDNPDIIALAGYLAVDKGDYAGAIADFNKAIAKDPNNLKTRYALYQAIQQQGGPNAAQQGEDQLKQMLQVQPANVAVMLELATTAAKNGDAASLILPLKQAREPAEGWPAQAQSLLSESLAAASNPRLAVPDVIRLRNVLETDASYQRDLAEIQVPEGTIADPIAHFITLPSPSNKPAPPDTGLTFLPQPIPSPGKASLVMSVWLSGSGKPATVTVDAKQVVVNNSGAVTVLPFPGGGVAPNASSILPVDLDDDGRVDLVIAGAGGLSIYRQTSGGALTDVTSSTKLPASITKGKWTGAWPANMYTGGAIDVVLGSASGPATVLRNNDNGTFTVIHPFEGVDGLRGFQFVDLDGDGVGDAALIDGGGRLKFFHNARAGNFEQGFLPARVGDAVAVSGVDLDRNGTFELVVWNGDGTLYAVSYADGKPAVKPLPISFPAPSDGSARLIWADLDNNGALDLIATGSTGTQIWLGDENGGLEPTASKVDARSVSIDDDGVSGRLNLIGTTGDGTPTLWKNQGTKAYHWQQIHLAAVSKGDGKNNSFGVGGTIALRSGLLYEDQPIIGPVTHFGLGTNDKADYARIVWPNGNPQAEFELKPDQLVATSERLKGSCPWLFAWDGTRFQFLKDFLWRSALGLRIDAQDTSGGGMTGDWNKIDGDRLVPKDGSYDLRLDTQLWESYFFDELKLMTVDHPAGTQMWVDERFCIPPPALAYHITTPARPVAHAVDDRGNDVTDLLSAVDGRYVDSFGLGRYQGLTRDHWVQVDLGPAPGSPLVATAPFPNNGVAEPRQWLLAEGWIHPTDSSINMQLSLGDHPKPEGLSLEIPDGHGGWRVARTGIGFPEGKNKTIMIDLSGLFKPGEDRQVRLRTNLELYWDWMATATEIPGAKVSTHVIDPSVADLRYHGFNHVDQASSSDESHSQPEVPDYGRLASVGQQWRDMEGFYTRYGDVRELLKAVDDRYVIMNAGDEIALEFPEQPAPAPGYVRDFVMIGDGWGKDCDINSGFSKTVLPLPSHADLKYNRPAVPLEDDPVYKAHKADWYTYQTRYVSPRSFETDLVR